MQVISFVRNNIKKTVFFSCLLGYGSHYLVDRKRNGELMQAYCLEALKYSRERIDPEKSVRRAIVLLNPMANQERGRFLYDKHVAPLLHLSGLDVRLIRLDKNNDANEYLKDIEFEESDCIVVAGGNATLSEVISGLLHRQKTDNGKLPPIAVVPIGETNTFAHKWLNMIGAKRSTESEIRLLASSAMAVIKGEVVDADLIKVSLKHSRDFHTDQIVIASKSRSAYNLFNEDKMYALSNISCGFLTETDSNIELFRYWWKLKQRMSRYFMKRYLRRDPIKLEFVYKLKCHGCSNCLNEAALKRELNELVTTVKSTSGSTTAQSGSTLLRLFYNKLVNVVPASKSKEDPTALAQRERHKKEVKTLLERSKQMNKECGKVYKSNLIQAQIIARINNPELENPDEPVSSSNSYIDTAIVKDPEFNPKVMFLAERKEIVEFEIKRLHSDVPIMNKNVNSDHFSIDIDGEIYKLANTREADLAVRVMLLPKQVRLIRADPSAMHVSGRSSWPKIFLVSRKTLEEELMLSDEQKNVATNALTPNLLPFEKYFLKYWRPPVEDLKLSNS